MGKKKRERDLPENEAKAVARMLRVSPQKLNLVAQLIRGKKVAAALADLEFSRKRIARDVRTRRCRGACREGDRDQTFSPARPWPHGPDIQTIR